MHILMVDRDMAELRGMEWYLTTYLSSNAEIYCVTTNDEALHYLQNHIVNVVIGDIELMNESIRLAIAQQSALFIATTAQPIFLHAMKAIQLQAVQLFVKPVPLDALKKILLSLTIPKVSTPPVINDATNQSLYKRIFLHDPAIFECKTKQFFIIEPDHSTQILPLYNWLLTLPIFTELIANPLHKRILCIAHNMNLQQLTLSARMLIEEWHMLHDSYINIGIYDGLDTTLQKMYNDTKKALTLRFYKGYKQIIFSSEQIAFTPLDPLLTPDEQQFWIQSLESGDIQAIKQFLQRLTETSTYYQQGDVRIHLTSILAQIRRFMMKYHLQQQSKIEASYRKLFNLILEGPILYSIIQEITLFTQTLMHSVTMSKQQLKADYSELATEIVYRDFADTSLSLHSVAKKLGVSANYLSSLFSKKQGIPFKRYVQNVRIQQALKVLTETNFSIAEVAQMNGFEDVNYFIKVFKQQQGTTPYRYRSQWLSEQ
ncbi:helix-turn-helix domain-containing protein [Solibacillus sp. CAU 1738]|uniref:helix-turn-helix domain-containing protein n=1 Tax=Solibacillus sp. CAU 1738 TaxID=3140363 RepID=UPI003261B70B